MAIATPDVHWTPHAIKLAVQWLWMAANKRPKEGLGQADLDMVLASYSEYGRAELLELAIDRKALLQVSRMRIDEDGNVTSDYRYHSWRKP